MDVNVKQIDGVWTLGYSLDKHTLSSTPIGPNQSGHMQFDTTRSEAGEALFQLKYRSDYSQVGVIANQLSASFGQKFSTVSLVVPMPASTARSRQPVIEISIEYARLRGIPCCEDLLVKTGTTAPMKDIDSREDKVSALIGAFTVCDVLPEGQYDVLILDDLFDTGSSLEAATIVLRNYSKIGNVYVATVTRKS